MNGVEVENLRPQIPEITSMLNQKAHLFSTTVLNNIRLGNQDASDEEVYEAAKKSSVARFYNEHARWLSYTNE